MKCQKDDWPRHKIQCNKDQDDKTSMPESARKTLEDMIIWDRKNRKQLISAAISALDLCHHPENADKYVFFVGLTDTPGAKHRYQVGFAITIPFEQYKSIFGNRAGDPRDDQRIGSVCAVGSRVVHALTLIFRVFRSARGQNLPHASLSR
ncbi:hypothetical protein K438DRAFT_1859331 [Mycena galopus ATCC 62051]|nr:hypothetical protein K438DRAFT_1859331 [Mycena galopus ATCC 62051]